MKNLIKAILSVMREVKGMEKNSRVGKGTKSAYDGTKDKDVKEVFNKAMADNGLIILPIDIKETTQVDRWQEETNWGLKQKQSVFTKVVVKYVLMHETGENIELAGYGHGIDTQDKGAGKATTYALKNALLYSFLTPVGKIEDTDLTHSNDIVTPQETRTPQPKKQEAPKTDVIWLTKKQYNKALTDFSISDLEKTIKRFSTSAKKMSEDEKTSLQNRLNLMKSELSNEEQEKKQAIEKLNQ